MSEFHKLLYSTDRNIARITLNRPEKRNALDDEMIGELRSALHEIGRASCRERVLLGV